MSNLCNSAPDGVHYLIELFGCDRKQLDSISFWKALFLEAASAGNLRVLSGRFHRFSPHGMTGYILLSTSHLSVHTWPEYSYAACDVFSCGGDTEAFKIVHQIKKTVDHEKAKTRKVKRGFKVTQQ